MRAYVSKLFAKRPHLIYFLVPDTNALRTFLFCMINVRVVSRSGESVQLDSSEQDFNAKLKDLVDAALSYGAKLGDIAGAREHLAMFGI